MPPPPLADPPRRRRPLARAALWLAAVVTVLLVAVAAVAAFLFAGADVSTAGDLAFRNPLRIPDLVEGRRGDDGVVRFELDVVAGTTPFLDGAETATWGVNGTYLGPTLRATRGDRVEVAVSNRVDETTSMHWHGMHLPAAADGGPHQPIEPGATWRPTWTVDQPAATLWYHPHAHGSTADHVHRGVAGLFLVDDADSAALDLPDTYGVDDVPVIIQDRQFDGGNQFRSGERPFTNVGQLGDELLVNGTHDPHLGVTAERIRLRIVNASNARTYDLGLVDGRTLQLVATDGGLLPAPVVLTRVPLSPGERAEVVVTMAPGERAVLRSFPRGGTGFLADRFTGRDDTFDVLELRAAATLDPSPPVPAVLAGMERLDTDAAVATRAFRLSGTDINGRSMAIGRVDETVEAGTTEVWDVVNRDGVVHNFHVHGTSFHVVAVDGEHPPAHLGGWKDTVEVLPGATARLAVRFGPHADPDVPYMLHCHVLAHEDGGMTAQFVVVEPGQRPSPRPAHHGHGDPPAG